MSLPESFVKVTQDSKQIGERFAASIESILRRLRFDRVTVPEKDRERLNKCYAPGHPDYIEYTGDFQSSEAYRFLDTLAQSLRRNPSQRTFIVDHIDTKCTEDSVWLSLPKWQHEYDLPSIYWHVVTERLIEKSVFRETFLESDWDIEHDDGPRGTTFVSKYVYADENNGPEDHTIFKRHYGALFSDQPEIVAQQGRDCGDQLYHAADRFGTIPKPVVRVFRCAPREALVEGITRVIKQQPSDNVFDIWIRHSEAPMKMLEGFGKYEFEVNDTFTSPLAMLTSILVSDEATDDATVVSIPSPLSYDTMPMKSSMNVALSSKGSPETGTGPSHDTAEVSPLNDTEVHMDSTLASQISVEAVLTSSMSHNQNVEDVIPSSFVADTPKRGSTSRNSSLHSESDLREKTESLEAQSPDLTPSNDKEGTDQFKEDSEQTPPKPPATSLRKKVPSEVTSIKIVSTPSKDEEGTNQFKEDSEHSLSKPPSASLGKPSEVTPNKASVARDSTSLSKDGGTPAALDPLDQTKQQTAHSGKNTHPRKKRSKKKSKSPTRSQVSPKPNFQEEKKDIDDTSQSPKEADLSAPFVGVQSTVGTENVPEKELQHSFVCSACKKYKTKTEFSKTQLRKKEERRCADCLRDLPL